MELLLYLLLFVSVLGAVNALVFTLVMLGVIQADSPFVTRICRMDTGDCSKVVNSPRARLIGGIPNTVVGLVWYIVAAGSATYGLVTGLIPFMTALLIVSAFTVVISLFLIYSLITRLKVVCKFCYMGHFCNIGIFIILLLLFRA